MANLFQAPPAQSNSFLFFFFLELEQIGKVASEAQIQELRNKNTDTPVEDLCHFSWQC